jgi:hypothetical protein
MSDTRRGFLKTLGLGALGAGAAIPILDVLRPGRGDVLAQVGGAAYAVPGARFVSARGRADGAATAGRQ